MEAQDRNATQELGQRLDLDQVGTLIEGIRPYALYQDQTIEIDPLDLYCNIHNLEHAWNLVCSRRNSYDCDTGHKALCPVSLGHNRSNRSIPGHTVMGIT